MISKKAAHELAKALGRANPDTLEWEIVEKGKYSIDLPNLRVLIAPQSADSQADLVFEVDALDGTSIGIVEFKENEEGFEDVSILYRSATQALEYDWNKLVEDIALKIQHDPDLLANSSRRTLPQSPPVPQRPSVDLAARFFAKIAGKWKCSWPTGSENAEIDSSGNYFLFEHIGGKGGIRKIFPTFRLILNSGNEDLTQVEISKQMLNGQTRQIEVLKVTNDKMEGFAKHDEHRVIYTRY